MKNQTKILDDILNKGLRPWLPQNSFDEKYAAKFRGLKEYESEIPLQYQIEFYRPTDHKTKYYSRLILNSVKSDYDRIFKLINEDKNENEVLYWLNDTLNKRLETRIKDLGKLIKEKDYSPTYIDPKNASYQLDKAHKSNAYIMQLLKLAYMQLYLEIQEAFKEWVNDILIVEDFYSQLLNELIPDKIPIKYLQIIEVEPETIKTKKPTSTNKTIQFYSFTYEQYNTDPSKIGDLYNSLKLNGFISSDTPFPTFSQVFSGKDINAPVNWTGLPSDLFYFIKLIYNDLKLVKNLKQKQWQIACKCFVDENGNTYDSDKLRRLKKPELTADKIESAVNLLK